MKLNKKIDNFVTSDQYKEYLNSGEWKYIKGMKIKNANFTCEGCGENGKILEVHHLTYDRVGMELLIDLVALCRECHAKIHNRGKETEWHTYLNQITFDKPKEKSVKDIEFKKMLDSI